MVGVGAVELKTEEDKEEEVDVLVVEVIKEDEVWVEVEIGEEVDEEVVEVDALVEV